MPEPANPLIYSISYQPKVAGSRPKYTLSGEGLTSTGAGRTALKEGAIAGGRVGSTALTIAQGHTLQGNGSFGGILINRGTRACRRRQGPEGGGVMVDNHDGQIRIGEGGLLDSPNGIQGGEIEGLGNGGLIKSGTGCYENVILAGKLRTLGPMVVGGTITNRGSLAVTATALVLRSDTTLGGEGETVLQSSFIDSRQSHRLTIGAGHTLRGSGHVGGGYFGYNGTSVLNQGTILADNKALSLNIHGPGAFINQGLVQVNTGSILSFLNTARLTQDHAQARIVVNGLLRTPSIELQAGALSGTGTVRGHVNNIGGQVNPGASPGKLSIEGDYTQSADGDLLIELNGTAQGSTYDWLAITGLASLGGDLYLTLGYTPAEGETFTFLTSGGGITGAFAHVYVSSGWNATTTYTSHNVSVTLTAAVPEPQSIALMLAGLAVAGGMSSAKRRRPI